MEEIHRHLRQAQEIKLDLLVGPLEAFRDRLHVRRPRVRPRGDIKLHAHAVEEALHIDESPITIPLEGPRPGGEYHQAQVHVPQPFTYLLMKLFAFRDRKDDANKDLGRHHALDLYTTVAMQVESEYEESVQLGRQYSRNEHLQTAREIVASDFSTPSGIGVLRLREHGQFRSDFPVADFMSILAEVFRNSVP